MLANDGSTGDETDDVAETGAGVLLPPPRMPAKKPLLLARTGGGAGCAVRR